MSSSSVMSFETPARSPLSGRPLPVALRRALEGLLGCPLASVRLVVGAAPRRFGALAYAEGETVYLTPEVADLTRPRAVEVLAHELAHVVQQRGGRLPAGSGADGVLDDPALEAEARAVGRHCRQRLFPGAGAGAVQGPPLPQGFLAGLARTGGRGARQAIQCLRTSKQSFDDFAASAWDYFSTKGVTSAVEDLEHLYHLASSYNPGNTPAKRPLRGVAEYQQMALFFKGAQRNEVCLQYTNPEQGIDDWPQLNSTHYLAFYRDLMDALPLQVPPLASEVADRYLHVYAAPRRGFDANWRIGVNVVPESLGAATAAFLPILRDNPDIEHMKYTGTMQVGKPDSVIFYMRRDERTYARILDAVLRACRNLTLQNRFSAIWNEVAKGVAEAAEPPVDYISFTQYRCLVTRVAWERLRDTVLKAERSRDDFLEMLDNTLTAFGIPTDAPHRQEPLLSPPFTEELNDAFFSFLALWEGEPSDAYEHLSLPSQPAG